MKKRTDILIVLLVSWFITFSLEGRSPVYQVIEGGSVQDAINIASDGDTIFIGPGRYGVSLLVNKNLTFIGRATTRDGVVLYANNVGWIIAYIPNDTVRFKNITIAGYRNLYADSNSVVTYDSVHLIPRYFSSNPYIDTYRNFWLLKNAKFTATNSTCDTINSYYAQQYNGVETHITATIAGNSSFQWTGGSLRLHLVTIRDSAKFTINVDSVYSVVDYEYSYLKAGEEDILTTNNPANDPNYLANIANNKPIINIRAKRIRGLEKLLFYNSSRAYLKIDSTTVPFRVLGSAYLRIDSSVIDRIDGWHNATAEVYNSVSYHDGDLSEFGSHNFEFSLDNSSYTKSTFRMYNSNVIFSGDSGRYRDKGNPIAFYDVNVYMENCNIYRYANTWVLGNGGGVAGENAYPDIISVSEGDGGSQNSIEVRNCLFENVGNDIGANKTIGVSLASVTSTPVKAKFYNCIFKNSSIAVDMNNSSRLAFTSQDTLIFSNCKFYSKTLGFGFAGLDIFDGGYYQYYTAFAQLLKIPVAYPDKDTIIFKKAGGDTTLTIRYIGTPPYTYSFTHNATKNWLSVSNDAVSQNNNVFTLAVSASRNIMREERKDTLLIISTVTQDTQRVFINQEPETSVITDARIITGYTLGKRPLIYGNDRPLSIVLQNNGNDTLINYPVRRVRTGTNLLNDSVLVSFLAPGDQLLLNFPIFNPSLVGVDTVTISVPSDSNSTGNLFSYIQAITSDTYNYADTSKPINFAARLSIPSQLLLVKFHLHGSGYVNFVRAFIPVDSSLIGKSVYGIVLDSLGNELSKSKDSVISAENLGTYREFVIQIPPLISNTEFFVGIGGKNINSTQNLIGVQEESPVRANAYYRADSSNTTALSVDTTTGKFVLEGVVGPAPLPVEMTSFSATSKIGKVVLDWSTATEKNFNGFEIERKPFAFGQKFRWEKIGFVRGSGNSYSPKDYSYTDDHLKAGTYLYRLKIIDNDGTYTYSDEIKATAELPRSFSLLQNYPNPFNPETIIRFELPVTGNVKLEIYNTLGELMAVPVNTILESGTYSQIINTQHSRMTSGIYFYRLTVSGPDGAQLFNALKKMVVLK